MIEFKALRKADYMMLIALAIIFSVLRTVVGYFKFDISFIIQSFLLAFFLSFVILLIRKAGALTLFAVLSSFSSYLVKVWTATAFSDSFVLIGTAIILEIILMFMKKSEFSYLITLGLSMALGNYLVLFFVGDVTVDLIKLLTNICIIDFFIGIFAGILCIILWLFIKTTKTVIKFKVIGF